MRLALTALSTDPLLVWNYGTMGVISFISGIIFWIQFRHLDKEEDALNAIQAGHYVAHVDTTAAADSEKHDEA